MKNKIEGEKRDATKEKIVEIRSHIHMGYASIFEEDLFLNIQNGILINSRIADNRGKSGIDEIKKFVDDD